MKTNKAFYIMASIMFFQFIFICVLALQVWDRGEDSSDTRSPSPVVDARPKLPTPVSSVPSEKDNNMDMPVPDTIESPIVVARAKYGEHLERFMPFENKDKTEILKILAGLYPHGDQQEIRDKYAMAYDVAIQDFSTSEEKEYLLLIMLQVADDLWQIEEAHKGKDPFVDLPDTIIETEALLREAEAAGDKEEAKSLRDVITRLQSILERSANVSEVEAQTERRRQEREYFDSTYSAFLPSPEVLALIKDRGMPGSYSEYLDLLKGEGLLPPHHPHLASAGVLSESSTESPTAEGVVSPSPRSDPVRSLLSAQTSFNSWRVDLDENYFDVAISPYLTPHERDKYFPTAADRAQLKSRTTEMQRLVVSKIRDLIKDIPNATAQQKRDLTRQLVRENFHKDFADSILKALEQDADE